MDPYKEAVVRYFALLVRIRDTAQSGAKLVASEVLAAVSLYEQISAYLRQRDEEFQVLEARLVDPRTTSAARGELTDAVNDIIARHAGIAAPPRIRRGNDN